MTTGTALGLDAARALDPSRFCLGGKTPRAAIRPVTREELSEALRAASRDGLRVLPWGGGVSLSRERAPERYDIALDLGALDRVVEYEPEDVTVTAECGITLDALRRVLAARGQELPIEGALANRATLGGALAANASGPRRLRFGSPRDRILGARFALADGTLTRTGGRVVKNVTGYGIHRLLCGSRGGLAVMIEASLKLVAAPARRAALIYHASTAEMADRERWARFPRLEPAALTVLGGEAAESVGLARGAAPFVVIVGLEEDAPWLERQTAMTIEWLGSPAERLEGAAVEELWQRLADLEEREDARMSFTSAHNTPAGLASMLLQPEATRLVFHALAGRLHLFPPPRDAQAIVHRLAAQEFTLIEARNVDRIEPTIPPQLATQSLRSRIRTALDPGQVMAFGERWERG